MEVMKSQCFSLCEKVFLKILSAKPSAMNLHNLHNLRHFHDLHYGKRGNAARESAKPISRHASASPANASERSS